MTYQTRSKTWLNLVIPYFHIFPEKDTKKFTPHFPPFFFWNKTCLQA